MQNNETDKAVAKVIESAGRYAPELWADLVASARLGGVLTLLATLAAVVIFTLLRSSRREGRDEMTQEKDRPSGHTVEIVVRTPQFERTPDMPPAMWPPKTREDFEALRRKTSEQLTALGLGSWDGGLFLFPAEWFEHIPQGFVIEDINGERTAFDRETEDSDTRFGCLAYGVRIGPTTDGCEDEFEEKVR